jgi:hypothetical protein
MMLLNPPLTARNGRVLLVVVVCRISTEHQDERSLQDQEALWGDQARLDALLQMYAVEKARLESRRRGHTVTEQALADGTIKLTVHVGGAA